RGLDQAPVVAPENRAVDGGGEPMDSRKRPQADLIASTGLRAQIEIRDERQIVRVANEALEHARNTEALGIRRPHDPALREGIGGTHSRTKFRGHQIRPYAVRIVSQPYDGGEPAPYRFLPLHVHGALGLPEVALLGKIAGSRSVGVACSPEGDRTARRRREVHLRLTAVSQANGAS